MEDTKENSLYWGLFGSFSVNLLSKDPTSLLDGRLRKRFSFSDSGGLILTRSRNALTFLPNFGASFSTIAKNFFQYASSMCTDSFDRSLAIALRIAVIKRTNAYDFFNEYSSFSFFGSKKRAGLVRNGSAAIFRNLKQSSNLWRIEIVALYYFRETRLILYTPSRARKCA
jgi:hypothetical protein